MSVTLEQILTLSGRLDDMPGFDVPRERFRRFLLEHARDTHTARALIDQCQHTPGEQHRRALQDLVVLLGRFLGFDAAFGVYEPAADAVKYHGHWRSPSQLHVVVEVRTDQAPGAGVDAFVKAVAAAASRGPRVRPAGLSVLTPLAPQRHTIDAALAGAHSEFPVAVLTLGVLLSLADMAAAGRVTHDDVVRVIESRMPVAFIVDLLERSGTAHSAETEPVASAVPTAASAVAPSNEPGFWIATVAADQATAPEQWLELVVGQRHIFGIAGNATVGAAPKNGDRICFYIPGKGVVGNGRVRALATAGTGIRDAERFRQILHLDGVELNVRAPIGVDFESQLRLRTAAAGAGRHTQVLARISHDSFVAMTSPREDFRGDRTARRADRGGPRSA